MTLHSFAEGSDQYVFADECRLQAYVDNFAELVVTTNRMLGVSGGFTENPDNQVLQEVGFVRQDFVLVAETASDMEAKRDKANGLLTLGTQKLVMRPTNYPTDNPRYCMARLMRVDMPEQEQNYTNLRQPGSFYWRVEDPRWKDDNDLAGYTYQAIGLSSSFTFTNEGNAIIYPRIEIENDAFSTFEDLKIQRLDGSNNILDEVSYDGVVGNNQILIIDAESWSVTLDGSDAYGTAFDFVHPDWFRMLPGDNSIRVLLANSGDFATVKFAVDFAWY